MERNTTGLKRNAGPGRPKGALNKVTVAAKGFCKQLADDPAYRESLQRRLLKGTLAPGLEMMVWHYAYGKPKDLIGFGEEGAGVVTVLHRHVHEDGRDGE